MMSGQSEREPFFSQSYIGLVLGWGNFVHEQLKGCNIAAWVLSLLSARLCTGNTSIGKLCFATEIVK